MVDVPTLLVILGGSVVGLGSAWACLWSIPWRTWRFEHGGHDIVVKNYMVREVVYVDGERMDATWVDGDRTTSADHRLTLADGTTLLIEIRTRGMALDCRAYAGRLLVFDSYRHAGLQDETTEPDPDPRRAAAAVLLRELRDHPDPGVQDGVATLKAALGRAFSNLAAAQTAAEAHATLAGRDDPVSARVVERCEQELGEVLDVLRQVHLAATAERRSSDRVQLDELLGRLDAHQEVEQLSSTRRRRPRERDRS